jgi:hypothetical protein
MPPDERARSCSKASSHCPGKRRNRIGPESAISQCPGRSAARAKRSGALQTRDRSSPSRPGLAAVPDQRRTAYALRRIRDTRHAGISHPPSGVPRAQPLAPKGKPPGGDPAAPVRRRSCRGAGSATAGARLLYVVTKGAARQSVPCPSCPYQNRAHPIGGSSFPRVSGTCRDPVRRGG